MFLTLSQIVTYINNFGVSVSIEELTPIQQSYFLMLGNFMWLFLIVIFATLIWKVFSRVINNLF